MRCLPPVGVPLPTVSWRRDGSPLKVEQDTNIIISSEGSLVFAQARVEDSANYTCVAENVAAKRVSNRVQLQVYSK